MLTKRKDVRRLDPEKGVNKLFENVLCRGRIQIFFENFRRVTAILVFFVPFLRKIFV